MPPRRRRIATTEDITIASLSYPQASSPNNPTAEHWGLADTDGDIGVTEPPATDADNITPPRLRAPRLDWNDRDLPRPLPAHGPLHTHDKVSPKAIIAGLMNSRKQDTLFDHDFNGYTDAQGNKPTATDLRFHPYEYSGNWHNRLIRATAQRAMLSLLHREQMRGQVNLIYIDPPYNNSFRSNFAPQADDLETDEKTEHIPCDPMAIQAFRDTYQHGVDSYLHGLKDELELARELLAEDGSIILQIGPDNLHYVAVLMSEVFGFANHVATIPYRTGNTQGKFLGQVGNWLIWYTKDAGNTKYRQLHSAINSLSDAVNIMGSATQYEAPDGSKRPLRKDERDNPAVLPKVGRLFTTYPLVSEHHSKTRSETFYYHKNSSPCQNHYGAWDDHQCSTECDQGITQLNCPIGKRCGPQCTASAYPCPTGKHWTVSLRGLQSTADQNRLHGKTYLRWIRYSNELAGRPLDTLWQDGGVVLNSQYIVETPPRVLDRCVLMTTDPGDLVLDLTCGSGAMPIACERWGRRWIAADVSAVSIAIARDRITTTTHPTHLLKDTPEGHHKDWKLEQALLPPDQRDTTYHPPQFPSNHIPDPAKGFVNERQIRVSAATLAYGPNPDGSDVIRHPDRTIKAAGKVRVSADFDVCSDSPYRTLSPNELLAQAAGPDPQDVNIADLIRDTGFSVDPVTERVGQNLQTCGISANGHNRYQVENLQPAVYEDITHTGDIIGSDGQRHTAAFYIGRADEIIAPNRVDRAAQDALLVKNCRYLVIIGFAQDADAISAGRPWEQRLTLLYVNAHRDLQLPDLADQRRNNAFTIISEPEVKIARTERPDEYQLTVTGICAFNSTEGYTTGHGQSEIMALMVDTAYDGERFLPTRYNVLPCKRNRKTLKDLYAAFKGRISDANWRQMQTLTTVPFRFTADPETGHTMPVAVKVIDQTGTEHKLVIERPESIVD